MLSLILTSLISAAAGAAPCASDLTVTSHIVRRPTGVRTIYEFARDSRRRGHLEVYAEPARLVQLRDLGVTRLSRAARALGWSSPLDSNRELTLVHLHFVPGGGQALRYGEEIGLYRKSVRRVFADDFTARGALVAAAVAELGPGATALVASLNGDGLSWRDYEEVAHLGRTRFAARTWLATELKKLGAHGALASAHEMPERAIGAPGEFTRHSLKSARENGWGPRLLLFRPARP